MSDDETILAPFVGRLPGRCGGEPTVAGTRLNTGAVASFWSPDFGQHVDRAIAMYPHISAEQAIAAIAFERGRELERVEIERLREKLKMMQRRAQRAEGIADRVAEDRPRHGPGRSFGRALANYAAHRATEELGEARAEIERLRAELEALRALPAATEVELLRSARDAEVAAYRMTIERLTSERDRAIKRAEEAIADREHADDMIDAALEELEAGPDGELTQSIGALRAERNASRAEVDRLTGERAEAEERIAWLDEEMSRLSRELLAAEEVHELKRERDERHAREQLRAEVERLRAPGDALRAVALVRRDDGRTMCIACRAAWAFADFEAHATTCPVHAWDRARGPR